MMVERLIYCATCGKADTKQHDHVRFTPPNIIAKLVPKRLARKTESQSQIIDRLVRSIPGPPNV